MADIDIGAAATDRAEEGAPYTVINAANPANATGSITSVEIWAYSELSNCEVATFEEVDTDTLTTRDSEVLGTIASGSKQTSSGLDMDVTTGDYLGLYASSGEMETSVSGGGGLWQGWDDYIPCTNYAFDFYSGYETSLYGEGDAAPVTEKTSSDTGSGADAKASGNPLATYSRSETGSGVEAMPARGITLPDSGSGVEALIGRAIVLAQAGAGVDTLLSLLGKVASDIGAGAENSYLHILEGVKSSSDTGAGADASSLEALFERDETGSGVEAVVARALYAREYPTGAIDLAKVLTAVITGAETGTGAEASLQSYYYHRTETGSGVDASTLEALFSRDDVGAGAEAITLLAAMLASDSGQGVETVLSYLRKLVDSGVGSEVVQLIGYIGRSMRAFTYKKPYFNTRLYARPYFNTRVYTKGEVMDTQTFRRGATVPIWVDNKTWAGVYANPTQGFKITIWDPDGTKLLLDPPDNYEVAMEESETGKFVYYYNSAVDDPVGWYPYECKGVDGTGEAAKTVNPMGSFELK